MTTVEAGRAAEDAAVRYLQSRGFRVLNRNWRTRSCEIDIVAIKERTVYFVEVKFRSTERQGEGLAYVTAAKLRQMKYAAEYWVARYRWQGDYCLMAASVAGRGRNVVIYDIV